MTFVCGSLLLPKKVSIFVRLPGTWGNQIYDSSDLFSLYQTWKWRGPIAIQWDPCPTWIVYGSILRQGRCRNGWWGQDPDQGATRHCDVRDLPFVLRSLEMVPIFPTSLLSISWVVYRWLKFLKDDAFSDLLRKLSTLCALNTEPRFTSKCLW